MVNHSTRWINFILRTDFSPLCIYFTSAEMKQLSCKKFSFDLVTGSSGASVHFISTSKAPPKNCSMNELDENMLSENSINIFIFLTYLYLVLLVFSFSCDGSFCCNIFNISDQHSFASCCRYVPFSPV